MGFNPFKAVTRALGIKDKHAQKISNVFPITALFGAKPYGVDLYGSAATVGKKIVGLAGSKGSSAPQGPYLIPVPGQSGTNISYQAPSYGAPAYDYGGSVGAGNPFDAWGYTDSFNPIGGTQPWGSSTMYSTPSVTSYLAYSPPVQEEDRSWEALVGLLPLFL